jgi:hypothetical protein
MQTFSACVPLVVQKGHWQGSYLCPTKGGFDQTFRPNIRPNILPKPNIWQGPPKPKVKKVHLKKKKNLKKS